MKERRIRELNDLLEQKETYIGKLFKEIHNQNQKVVREVRKPYKAIKGDKVDEMLQRYINEQGVDLPITRLGNQFYMFGTKKIYAKIINDKLVVRVGGGFMGIDEFINTYGQQELQKVQRMTPDELKALHTPTEEKVN